MKINVKVHAKSGRQKIINKGDKHEVYLKSAPENNKANIELIKLMKKHFGKSIEIKSGLNSRNKIVEVRE